MTVVGRGDLLRLDAQRLVQVGGETLADGHVQVDGEGSQIFQGLVRQHLLRHQALEPRILGFKLLQAPQMRHGQPTVELPPPIVGLLRNPVLATDLSLCRRCLRFL